MKILSLEIENFLVLTKAEVRLADRGLVLIQGVNEEDSSASSNGAGKSSIADALCWAVYGVTARDETGDAVINNKAGKNTRVAVTIEDDGAIYTVARHRKHKQHKNALTVSLDAGAGLQDLTKGTDKLTQEVVDKIMGCSLEVFVGSIYAGQEKMPDLPAMTDKMLKILIEEAAGINALESAYVLARSKMQAAKVDVDASRSQFAQVQSTVSVLSSQKTMAEQDDQTWAANQAAKISGLLADKDLIEAALVDAEAKVSEIDLAAVGAEIAQIDQKLAGISIEQRHLHTLQSSAGAADSAAKVAESEAKRAVSDYSRTEAALKGIQHKIGCPCDTCGRPLTQAEIAAAEKAANDAHDQSRAMIVAVKTTIADTAAASQRAAQAVQDFAATMTDASQETARRATLESLKQEGISRIARRDQLMGQVSASDVAISRAQAEVSPFGARIAALDGEIARAAAQAKVIEGELTVRLETLELETEVVRVFSPAGVRSRVLDEVTPYLNAQTGKYLAILSDGNIEANWSTLTVAKSGEVKEKFSIDVSSPISSKTFKGFSGGEKRKVRVATALALQDLVSTRATKPIELFIGDEIDDALDPAGLERLMVVLEEKARERGTVMVISHNSLRDEISNVLKVTRSATGETTIEEGAF